MKRALHKSHLFATFFLLTSFTSFAQSSSVIKESARLLKCDGLFGEDGYQVNKPSYTIMAQEKRKEYQERLRQAGVLLKNGEHADLALLRHFLLACKGISGTCVKGKGSVWDVRTTILPMPRANIALNVGNVEEYIPTFSAEAQFPLEYWLPGYAHLVIGGGGGRELRWFERQLLLDKAIPPMFATVEHVEAWVDVMRRRFQSKPNFLIMPEDFFEFDTGMRFDTITALFSLAFEFKGPRLVEFLQKSYDLLEDRGILVADLNATDTSGLIRMSHPDLERDQLDYSSVNSYQTRFSVYPFGPDGPPMVGFKISPQDFYALALSVGFAPKVAPIYWKGNGMPRVLFIFTKRPQGESFIP